MVSWIEFVIDRCDVRNVLGMVGIEGWLNGGDVIWLWSIRLGLLLRYARRKPSG